MDPIDKAVIVRTTAYDVSLVPEEDINAHSFTITVAYRGRGLWAVCYHSCCLSTKGDWDYEVRTSEREEDWLATHRFDLDTALRLAREKAPGIRAFRLTAAEYLAEKADDRVERHDKQASD